MCGGGPDKPEQSAEEKELAKIAIEKWNDNQDMYFDVQKDYIKDVQMDASDFAEGRGRAATGANMAFGDAREDLSKKLMTQGATADSGRFQSAVMGLSEDQGLATGTSLNETEMAIDNAHLGGLQSVVDMGLGQESKAFAGMGRVAGQATQDSIDRAGRSFKRRAGLQQLAGTAAGIGAGAYQQGMFSGGPDLQGQSNALTNNTAFVKRM